MRWTLITLVAALPSIMATQMIPALSWLLMFFASAVFAAADVESKELSKAEKQYGWIIHVCGVILLVLFHGRT